MTSLGAALALVLVIEGLMPLAAPSVWRTMVRRVAELKDGQIRFFGMLSVAGGVLMLLVLG